MGLRDQKCDRCQKLSQSLFRLERDLQRPTAENPWYCPNCMRLMGQPLDRETLRLMDILTQLPYQRDED